jgi:hypothetical protein
MKRYGSYIGVNLTETDRKIIKMHVERYPRAQPRDVYKLIFQGVYGVGHIITGNAMKYLREEAGRIPLEGYPDRPLIEPVSPDGSMVRVNLRPFLRMNLSLEGLFSVMTASVDTEGDDERFIELWRVFVSMVETGEIKMDSDGIKEVQEVIDSKGIKSMHHTEPYRQAYYPAYRVVRLDLFRDEFGEPEHA